MNAVRIAVDPVASLRPADLHAIAELLDRTYAGIDPAQVARDLSDKTHVLRLFIADRLHGLTTFAYGRSQWRGESVGVIWSGDTVVEAAARHAAHWPAHWMHAVREAHGGRGRLAWNLICSDARTWRFQTACLRRSVPHDDDTELSALCAQLSRERYGRHFSHGIVRLAAPQRLRRREALAQSGAAALEARFAALNPGWREGDELACAGWLDPRGFTPLALRWWTALP